ncbi:hypothetical protein BHE74_00032968 [Ensete ventricosum]|nr:hypothetical protein BHE74_00032968 [Ensete ventricosum]
MPVGSRTSRPRSRHQLLPRHRRSNHDPLTPVASRMNDGISGNGGGSGLLSPIFIFFLVVVLQTLDGLLELVKRVSEFESACPGDFLVSVLCAEIVWNFTFPYRNLMGRLIFSYLVDKS